MVYGCELYTTGTWTVRGSDDHLVVACRLSYNNPCITVYADDDMVKSFSHDMSVVVVIELPMHQVIADMGKSVSHLIMIRKYLSMHVAYHCVHSTCLAFSLVRYNICDLERIG